MCQCQYCSYLTAGLVYKLVTAPTADCTNLRFYVQCCSSQIVHQLCWSCWAAWGGTAWGENKAVYSLRLAVQHTTVSVINQRWVTDQTRSPSPGANVQTDSLVSMENLSKTKIRKHAHRRAQAGRLHCVEKICSHVRNQGLKPGMLLQDVWV